MKLTRMLVIGIAGSLLLLLLAVWRYSSAADQARRSEDDWQVCQRDFVEVESLRARRTLNAPLASSDSELNRRLNASAVSAGLTKELTTIEPATPTRLRDSDYTQTAVYLQLNSVSLRQLVTFLDSLTSADAAVRARTIELNPAASSDFDERWTTALALDYLTYAPRGRESGR